jgi:hypothetical protein
MCHQCLLNISCCLLVLRATTRRFNLPFPGVLLVNLAQNSSIASWGVVFLTRRGASPSSAPAVGSAAETDDALLPLLLALPRRLLRGKMDMISALPAAAVVCSILPGTLVDFIGFNTEQELQYCQTHQTQSNQSPDLQFVPNSTCMYMYDSGKQRSTGIKAHDKVTLKANKKNKK